jgi:hypothetical protein
MVLENQLFAPQLKGVIAFLRTLFGNIKTGRLDHIWTVGL